MQALAAFIEFFGAVVITAYAARSIFDLTGATGKDSIRLARLRVSRGVLLGLDYIMAAALLKALNLQSWVQIGTFATVLALRTILKYLFNWEKRQLLK